MKRRREGVIKGTTSSVPKKADLKNQA